MGPKESKILCLAEIRCVKHKTEQGRFRGSYTHSFTFLSLCSLWAYYSIKASVSLGINKSALQSLINIASPTLFCHFDKKRQNNAKLPQSTWTCYFIHPKNKEEIQHSLTLAPMSPSFPGLPVGPAGPTSP